jgi:nucleoside-triphosphatase THEP1
VMQQGQPGITKPEVERVGDDYTITWYDGEKPQVRIDVSRIHEHKDFHVDAEIEISDYTETNPQLLHPIRTSLTKTFRGLLSELKETSYRDDGFWKHRLTQMAYYCLQGVRTGEPVIDLSTREAPSEPRQAITDVAWEGMPTVIYGPGGVGKSMIALALANAYHTGFEMAGLSSVRGNALILDYETSWDETWRRSAAILSGAGLSRDRMVYYRFCTSPLAQDIKALKRTITELDVTFVVVDSVGPACGGDPELASSAISYFSALRAMSTVDRPVTTLSVAHVRKNDADSGGPFGSVYWTNLPRAVFEVKKGQRDDTNFIEVGLYHKKTNVGKLLSPKGFRITWSDGIRIESVDPMRSSLLAAQGKMGDRAYLALEDGPHPIPELAEMLGVGEKSLSSTLSLDSRFESVSINLNGTQLKSWQIKADIDVLG